MILYKYFTHKGNIRIEYQDYYGHLELGESNLFIVCDGIGPALENLMELLSKIG
jgi:serine/threonine protein phosphatase PrpC